MKRILSFSISVLFATGAAFTAVSCSEKEEKTDPVDLRYDAEDEYLLDAISPEPFSFVVRSLDDPWEVYSYHPDWCTIEPASGEMEDKYTVTVKYTDNEQLDDRIDTLVIKSDYWIGKWVKIHQKGIAYLTVNPEKLTLPKEETNTETDNCSFKVSANQKWTAEVTDGSQWLSIVDGSSGELDGEVTVSAKVNTGELRHGTVTLYDRHGKEAATVTVEQNGVLLEPETTELRVLYNVEAVELPVVSNAEWIAEKDDINTLWYDIENPSNNGNATLRITLKQNTSTSLRQATFTVKSKASEGSEPVTKQITIKQACNPAPQKHYFKNGLGSFAGGTPTITDEGATFKSGTNVSAANLKTGSYKFRFRRETQDAAIRMFYIFSEPGKSGTEFRWHINADVTAISTTPWWNFGNAQLAIDKTDTQNWHEMSMVMTEAEDGYMNATWNLDGKDMITICTKDIVNATFAPALWNAPLTIQFGCGGGSVTFEWYEFTPALDWGE